MASRQLLAVLDWLTVLARRSKDCSIQGRPVLSFPSWCAVAKNQVRINDELIEPLAACQLGLSAGRQHIVLANFRKESLYVQQDVGDPDRDAGNPARFLSELALCWVPAAMHAHDCKLQSRNMVPKSSALTVSLCLPCFCPGV